MLNIGSSDFGTYYPIIVPAPDEPVTVEWGSRVAWTMARITRAIRDQATYNGSTQGNTAFSYGLARFTSFPFLYQASKRPDPEGSDGTWTTEAFIGSGNSIEPGESPYDVSCSYFASVSLGSARFYVGKLNNGPLCLYGYGK